MYKDVICDNNIKGTDRVTQKWESVYYGGEAGTHCHYLRRATAIPRVTTKKITKNLYTEKELKN